MESKELREIINKIKEMAREAEKEEAASTSNWCAPRSTEPNLKSRY